jgi:hypothetical protein
MEMIAQGKQTPRRRSPATTAPKPYAPYSSKGTALMVYLERTAPPTTLHGAPDSSTTVEVASEAVTKWTTNADSFTHCSARTLSLQVLV